MSEGRTPLVYLVGAGPGDPGLLTLRAVECLGLADLVVYDRLLSPRILDFARPTAERIGIESLPGPQPARWPRIHQIIVEAARAGKVVVRLKGGDPLIFGRGTEEADALREAGIPYEFVPGITAAQAAASYAEIPLTHRACASAIALITGHENPTKPESSLDWSLLARFPGTLLLYMAMARLDLIAHVLLDNGKSPDTPAAVIQNASTGQQITRTTTLAKLEQMVRDEGLAAPAIVMIGPVVNFRPPASWFENKPLFGKRVLVTRPRHQAADLQRRLEQLGAITYLLPAVEIVDPPDWAPVDAAVARLAEFHWLVFTSANGVTQFFKRLLALGHDLRALGKVRIAVIGPVTAEELKSMRLIPDLAPGSFRSEELAAELKQRVAGKRVLLARADRGRDLLRQELSRVAAVEQVAVYSQIDAINTHSDVLHALSRGEIGYVTLTSSNIAHTFLSALDKTARSRIQQGAVALVSISPVTSEAIRQAGLPVTIEAKEFTVEGLIAALVAHAESKK